MAGKNVHNDMKYIAKRFGIKYYSFQDFANKVDWNGILNYNLYRVRTNYQI